MRGANTIGSPGQTPWPAPARRERLIDLLRLQGPPLTRHRRRRASRRRKVTVSCRVPRPGRGRETRSGFCALTQGKRGDILNADKTLTNVLAGMYQEITPDTSL